MPEHTTLERVTAYTYDNSGNKLSRTLPDTKVTTYKYDALNRLTEELYTGATAENRSYTYNLNGAVIEAVDASGKTLYTYDSFGRITSEEKTDLDDASLSTVSSVYDKASNRTQVTYPGSKVLTFTYDKRNLLKTVVDSTDTTTYTYDPNGNRISCVLPNSVKTDVLFDDANRVTQLKNEDSTPTNIYTTDYRMDKVGNRVKIVETRPSGTRNLIYTYDNVYRLLTESDDISGTAVTTTYTFDDAGNRLTKSDGTITTTYTVDQLNRVTSYTTDNVIFRNYAYDANGNRTSMSLTGGPSVDPRGYTYDRENRLVEVKNGPQPIFTAIYDYRTRRMTKVENSTTTNYVYDGGVNVQELDASRSLTKQLVRGTGMGGGIGSVLYNEDASASNRGFFCYNAIGSVVALTDSTGTVTSTSDYEAFGKVVRTTGSTSENRKFCTKERDASIGLDNFGFRYFDWELGRFITRDPSGYPDGPNNYLYCWNNPINFIDPLGLASIIDEEDEKITITVFIDPEKKVEDGKDKTEEIANNHKKILEKKFKGYKYKGKDIILKVVSSTDPGNEYKKLKDGVKDGSIKKGSAEYEKYEILNKLYQKVTFQDKPLIDERGEHFNVANVPKNAKATDSMDMPYEDLLVHEYLGHGAFGLDDEDSRYYKEEYKENHGGKGPEAKSIMSYRDYFIEKVVKKSYTNLPETHPKKYYYVTEDIYIGEKRFIPKRHFETIFENRSNINNEKFTSPHDDKAFKLDVNETFFKHFGKSKRSNALNIISGHYKGN